MPLTTTITVADCQVKGQPAIQATVGTTILNTHVVQLKVLNNASDAEAAAVISKVSTDGGVQVLTGDLSVYAALSAVDAALLLPGKVYNLLVKLVDSVDQTIVKAVYTYLFYPKDRFIAWVNPTTSGGVAASAGLSVNFLNTLVLAGEAGGAGYLDGIATVDQAVNCAVQFYVGVDEPPQQWILRASNAATDAGAKRRPLDYSVNNQKVWMREV